MNTYRFDLNHRDKRLFVQEETFAKAIAVCERQYGTSSIIAAFINIGVDRNNLARSEWQPVTTLTP